jgi:uncharacterized protein YbbC (DUF1343 family)/CubicO group peptidase (beta-lactamase class C family)
VKRAIVLLASSLVATSAFTADLDAVFHRDKLREIDAAIDQSIAEGKLPGGVVWLERNGRAYHRAYGSRALVPKREAMTEDTIFDAASLTKVTATAPSIWILIERGKIALDDPLSKYIPEFKGGWRDEVTIRHLLSHTSGLRPDLDMDKPWSGYDTGIKLATEEMPRNRPGYVFKYSDINFELLGEVVHRVSGLPLNEFAEREVFKRLKMRDTRFRPCRLEAEQKIEMTGQEASGALRPAGQSGPVSIIPCKSELPVSARIAPTEALPDGTMLRGVVHDPTARRMGGVAGHAGLFTTTRDLARYARMLLNDGSLDGVRIFRPATVKMLTSVVSPANVAVRRGGGWDIDSGFSRPRGDLFPLGSYGHTGFTGGIVWIDPFSKTFYAFLSNRVHPNGKGSTTTLQRTLGALSAQAVKGFDFGHVAGALPQRPGGKVNWIMGGDDVSNGIDVLYATAYKALQNLRIGLITNYTGIDRSGNPTADLLRSAPGVTLVSLFSPEHGIRGELDDNFGDSTDPVSGLPIFSLYGERRKPTAEQLANIDALVFDIQDVGTRFYTFISTLGLAIEAAGENHKRMIVLDRVNPIDGTDFEGPLSQGDSTFVAFHPIAVRHGMTVGELAKMFNEERNSKAELDVIALRNWHRYEWQDDAGLPWINTSPNMRNLTEATLYPGIGLLESAISVGRGTPTPFEIAGAPYIDADVLAREMNAQKLPGVEFQPIRFTPETSVFKGEACGGVRFVITDRRALRPVRTGVALAITLRRLYGERFEADKMERLLRDPEVLEAIKAAKPLDSVTSLWRHDEEAFKERRSQYLMYEAKER